MSEEESGGRVESDATHEFLEIEGIALAQTGLHLHDCVLNMDIEVFEVADAMLLEKGSRHVAMKLPQVTWKAISEVVDHIAMRPVSPSTAKIPSPRKGLTMSCSSSPESTKRELSVMGLESEL